MKLFVWITGAVLLSTSSLVFAIDGYKDIKFGISHNTLSKMGKCTLQEIPTASSSKTEKMYGCSDFPFSSKNVQAIFIFIDDKLMRLSFTVGDSLDDAIALSESLKNKYGVQSFFLDQKQAEAFDAGKMDTCDFAGFDRNTIIVRLIKNSNESNEMEVGVIYTHPKFEKARQSSKSKQIDKDL